MFGYGSLVTPAGRALGRRRSPHGFLADLVGFRRTWGVAMDNRRDLPGYKYYTDARGRRPEVFVTFLDICRSADPGAAVNGVCVPVDDAGLSVLDGRERNYERIDVSDQITVPGADGIRVWAYAGSAPGRDRLRRARAAGAAVIDATYLQGVHDGFALLGEAEHRACVPSLDPGDLPVVSLRRHDLP